MPRVARVTGAARGIGAATVSALAARGCAVLAVDRAADIPALPYSLGTTDELRAVERCAAPDRVDMAIADVRDNALAAAVAHAKRRWGALDAAFAVAGVIAGGAQQREHDPVPERVVLDIDLGGVLNLARVSVPAMLRRLAL